MSRKVVRFRDADKTAERRDRIARLEVRLAALEAELDRARRRLEKIETCARPEALNYPCRRFAGERLYHVWHLAQTCDGHVPLPVPYENLPEPTQRLFGAMAQRAIEWWFEVVWKWSHE